MVIRVKPQTQPPFDIVEELRNIFVNIPPLHAIKDVRIYCKSIRYMCLKRLGRKKQDFPTIHLVGQLVGLMLGKVSIPKYCDPGNPIMEVLIGRTPIPNTFINLGVSIM